MKNNLIVVGCGASKLPHPSEARTLYTGPVFKAARTLAERSGNWMILSAEHGLIRPEVVIDPYDRRVDLTDTKQIEWLASTIRRVIFTLTIRQITVLAGADYATVVRMAVAGAGGWGPCPWPVEIVEPLAGLGTGHRIQRCYQLAAGLPVPEPVGQLCLWGPQ